MSKGDAWMPLYVGDYLRDTGHLTTEEHGAYLLLLMQAWTKGGSLPADEARLRTVTKMDPKAWKASSATLLAFFQADGDTLRHKRITLELTKTGAISEKRKVAGKAGGEATKAKQKGGNDTKPAAGLPADLPPANGQQKGRQSQPQSHASSVPSEDGAEGAPSPDESALDKLWRVGPPLLGVLTKRPDGVVRKMLGRFVKQIDADHATLLEILSAAEVEQPDDPTAWITAAISNRVGELALSAPRDPYGIHTWTARQRDAKGDPPCINGYFVGMTAEKIADAIGMTGEAVGMHSACR